MTKTCGDCKHFEVDTVSAVCEKKRWICDDEAPACNRFDKKPTLFDRITQSPETLAETLVYCEQPEHQYSCASWRSVVLGSTSYARKSEALAATVAKLKEVAE